MAIGERNDLLCLTDMWRAAVGDPSRRPVEWRRLASAQEFSEHVADMLGISRHEAPSPVVMEPRRLFRRGYEAREAHQNRSTAAASWTSGGLILATIATIATIEARTMKSTTKLIASDGSSFACRSK
jgi:hypothetical protein